MTHYYSDNSNLVSKEETFEYYFNNEKFLFTTDNGVFSKRNVDYGSYVLIKSVYHLDLGKRVLDLGCGYGPIGIFISKIKKIKVDMLDINLRSIELSKKNSEINNVDTNVFYSNIYENVTKKYDFIISNPPIRVGNEILYKILFDAKKNLKNNGELWIVINKNQGAKTIMKKLEEIYDVELIAKNKGFYIIRSKIIDKLT